MIWNKRKTWKSLKADTYYEKATEMQLCKNIILAVDKGVKIISIQYYVYVS